MNSISSKNKEILKIIISWCLAVIWASVIFCLSAKTADESTIQSQGMITTFNGFFGNNDIDEELMTKIDGIVRETAHAVEYFILGILVYNAVFLCLNYRKQEELLLTEKTGIECRDRFRVLNSAILSILVCALYSLTDEIHQIPIPGRAFQILDLVIDFVGITIGIILIAFVYKIKNK